jgi:tRNA threonylcarbamoyladenosine modification (KEOPS) complex  Pcc1 subunit
MKLHMEVIELRFDNIEKEKILNILEEHLVGSQSKLQMTIKEKNVVLEIKKPKITKFWSLKI